MSIALQDLFARLGVKPDHASFARGKAELQKLGDQAKRTGEESASALGLIGNAIQFAFGFDLYGGIRRVASAVGGLFADGVKFNASMEESTTQIAGMLALSGHTRFADEIGTANDLMGELSRRAATLPGTTAEYIKMLGNITQPARAAGLSISALTDLTVGAVVAAKALGEDAGAAARDIGQALRGQAGADDPFIGKLLATAGFEGQAGREKFNKSSASKRAEIVQQLLTSPQLKDMAAAQGGLMSGMTSTLQDTISRFFGSSTKGIFDGIKGLIGEINAWADRHAETLATIASVISTGLNAAFNVAVSLARWVGEGISSIVDAAKELYDVLSNSTAAQYAIEAFRAALLGAWEVAKKVVTVIGGVLSVLWRLGLASLKIFLKIRDGVISVLQRVGILSSSAAEVKGAFAGVADVLQTIADVLEWIADAVTIVADAILWMLDKIGAAFHVVFDPLIDSVKWLVDSLDLVGGVTVGAGIAPSGALAKFNAIQHATTSQAVAPGVDLGPWASPSSGPVTTTYAPTINVTTGSGDPKQIADEIDKVWGKKMRQAASARPR